MSYTSTSGLFTGIGDAIRSKDGTTDPILHTDMPDRIINLPSGGSQEPVIPEDWPDIRAIVEADTDNSSPYKAIVLFSAAQDKFPFTKTVTVNKVKLNTGAEYTYTSTGFSIPVDAPFIPTADGGVRWAIYYGNQEEMQILFPAYALWIDMYSAIQTSNPGIGNKNLCRAIDGRVLISSNNINFENNHLIRRYPTILSFNGIKTIILEGNFALEEIPEEFMRPGMEFITTSCIRIRHVPQIGTPSAPMFFADYFKNCHCLVSLPLIYTTSDIKIDTIFGLSDFDSFVVFDGNNNVVGGMVYHLVKASSKSFTVPAFWKAHYSSIQQTKLSQWLTTKGYTLVWNSSYLE